MDKEAGPKIDWLSQGDTFQKEQDFLAHLQKLENEGHDVDALAPFLTKEFRQGNLRHYPTDPDEEDYGRNRYELLRQRLPNWSEWYRSRAFNRPGVNLMDPNFTVHSLEGHVQDWHERYDQEAPYIYDASDIPLADDWYETTQDQHLPRTRPAIFEDQEFEPPGYNWDDIAYSTMPTRWGRGGYDEEPTEQVYRHAKTHGFIPELGEAYQPWRDRQTEEWNNEWDQNYDPYPYTAEDLAINQEHYATPQEYEQALEEARNEAWSGDRDEAWADSPTGQWVNHMDSLLAPHAVANEQGLQYYNEPPQPPQGQQQVVGATGRDPRYYRWVYHPQDTTVTLDHNEADHPAYVKTHRDLAKEAPGPNPTHGYAYKIHGGWRLTDYEHAPVEDPFMVAQIVHALRGQKTRPGRQGSWESVTPDFSQLRYGQPFEDS